MTKPRLDATVLKDWEIAEASEADMVPFAKLGRDLGLQDDENGARVGAWIRS